MEKAAISTEADCRAFDDNCAAASETARGNFAALAYVAF